ncbi:MAG: NIPSNAP family protein [Dehalococcoidia bacterium]
MPDAPLIWELRTYTFYAGQAEPYLRMWGDEILPLYDEIGVRVVGCWLPDDNPLNYIWLRVYDSAEERAQKTVALRTHPNWPDISARIQQYESKAETRDFSEAAYSPLGTAIRAPAGGGHEPFGVYQTRLVHLKPGTREAFLADYEKLFIPLAAETGLTVLAVWLPADDPDAVFSLWGFGDDQSLERAITTLRAEPARQALASLFAVEDHIERRTLRPTSFSPLSRFLTGPAGR